MQGKFQALTRLQREFMAVCSGNQTLREEVTGPSIRKTQNKPKKNYNSYDYKRE